MEAWTETRLWTVMPLSIRDTLANLDPGVLETLEEVRVRAGRPVALYGHEWQAWLGSGGPVRDPREGIVVTRDDLELMVEMLADRSLHGREEELGRGYLTISGGHRAGIAGRAVLARGEVLTTRDWVGVNLRIARAVEGAADPVLECLKESDALHPAPSILLVSPPRGGKTTVLRDLIHALSRRGFRVGVVDERRELGSGGPPGGFDLGPHTDILDGWPKASGIEAAVRSLGLDVVAVDEIGDADDARAVRLARRSGVAVLATAHASGIEAARRHPLLRSVMADRTFDWVAELGRGRTPAELKRMVRVS